MPLFGKSSKSPVELIRGLKESLLTLEKGSDGKKQDKAQEDVSKHLQNITSLLFGSDNEQQSDIVLAQLSQEIYNRWNKANAQLPIFFECEFILSGLLLLLLKNLHRIDFEGKKDVAQLFNNVLRRQIGTR